MRAEQLHLDALRVAEARRVSRELIVLEQAWRFGRDRESRELRRLVDGSEHRVFKRYLMAGELARELKGVIVLASADFVAVRTPVYQLRSGRARRKPSACRRAEQDEMEGHPSFLEVFCTNDIS